MPAQFLGGRGLNMGLGSGGAVAGNGLLNNLIAYWPLNEAAGANDALDLHTNGLTLTQTHSPGSAAGKVYAGARTFDGANDYFACDSETLLVLGDADWTIAGWVLPGVGSYKMIIAKDLLGNREYDIWHDTDTAAIGFDCIGVATSLTRPVTAGQWSMFVAQHDSVADMLYLFVNGGAADSKSTGGTAPATTTAAMTIGRRAYVTAPSYYTGTIGPIAIWKSAEGGGGVLSAAQRTALYNAGNGLAYAGFTA